MPRTLGRHEAGCWAHSSRGRYMVDVIVATAETHAGFVASCDCSHGHEAEDGSYTEWANCEFASELIDEATEALNASDVTDEHYYWGLSEQGDWGLWPRGTES